VPIPQTARPLHLETLEVEDEFHDVVEHFDAEVEEQGAPHYVDWVERLPHAAHVHVVPQLEFMLEYLLQFLHELVDAGLLHLVEVDVDSILESI